jgi:hypothetical protein
MTERHSAFYILLSCVICIFGSAGCLTTYGSNAGGKLDITASSLDYYMRKAELSRPEVVQEVLTSLRSGKRFRKRIVDQKNRWCLTTVWVEQGHQNILHIVTNRDETCPKCGGSGKRKWDNQRMSTMPFDTRCLECDGKGYLASHTVERKYSLTADDFQNRERAERMISNTAGMSAPPEAQRYIDMLISEKAAERLRACIWLDQHYVQKGQEFHRLLPMLRKARWHEKDDKSKTMVWQFHAGKGMSGEYARAYYRVYADSNSGLVTYKGFYPEK